jgi:hypothetical protein
VFVAGGEAVRASDNVTPGLVGLAGGATPAAGAKTSLSTGLLSNDTIDLRAAVGGETTSYPCTGLGACGFGS